MKRFTAIALAALMVLTVFASVMPASALEVRGTVVDSGNGDAEANMTWTANNFAAFYYDLNDAATAKETLKYTNSSATSANISGTVFTIDKGELAYTAQDVAKNYTLYTAHSDVTKATTYSVIGWMAEKFVAVDGDAQKITKLLMEQKADDKKTLKTGESWDLGSGYTLNVEQIDVDGNKVWLTLSKDGVIVEDEILDTGTGKTTDDATMVAKADFAGKTDKVYFVTHVDAAFRGTSTDLVQLKYTWLIDKDAVTSISSEDTIGNFKVTGASLDMLTLTNDNSITLNADSKITFLENMYFQTSELGKSVTGTGILFYPAKEVTIGGAVPTTPTTPTTPVTPVTPVVNDTDTTTPADTTTPVVTPPVVTPPVEDADEEEPVEEEPGFEAIFAIAGLLAVAFFVRRN